MLARTASLLALATAAAAALLACSGADATIGDGPSSVSAPAASADPAHPAGSSGASASDDAGASSPTDGGKPTSDAGKPPAPWVGPACARAKPNMANVRYATGKRQSACTAANVAAIDDKLSRNVPYRTIESDVKAVAPACASCVFSNLADPSWGPLVYTSATGPAFRNFAGCWEVKGKSAACAKANATVDYCWRGVCDHCATEAELTECVGRASSDANGPCAGEYADADAKCGGLASVAGCQNVFEVVASMCGP